MPSHYPAPHKPQSVNRKWKISSVFILFNLHLISFYHISFKLNYYWIMSCRICWWAWDWDWWDRTLLTFKKKGKCFFWIHHFIFEFETFFYIFFPHQIRFIKTYHTVHHKSSLFPTPTSGSNDDDQNHIWFIFIKQFGRMGSYFAWI